MIGPTPLLDFFRRGEVARDVRLLAARGALAPRAYEQLAILILLLDDSDPEVGQTARLTVERLPIDLLKTFLSRPDTPLPMREFFERRGIRAEGHEQNPASDAEDLPLVEAEKDSEQPGEDEPKDENDPARKSIVQKLAEMGFTDRLKAAINGSRAVRTILIRDPNKLISASVLSNPRVSDQEVESFARMPNVPEEILRLIAGTRAWVKHYGVVVGLVRNPKTPLALSMNLMPRLVERDLVMLSMDRNVPDTLRVAARRKVVEATGRR